jgi:hypothetical protein
MSVVYRVGIKSIICIWDYALRSMQFVIKFWCVIFLLELSADNYDVYQFACVTIILIASR